MVAIRQLDRTFTANPMGLLRSLQAEAPVSRAVMWGGVPVWLVTGYEEAKALLADPRLSKDRGTALNLFPSVNGGELAAELTAYMVHTDPPDHARLRQLVGEAFTPEAVERFRPKLEAIADELLDEIDTGAPVDLIKSYAEPLVLRAVSDLLGIPVEYRSRFLSVLTLFLNQPAGVQKHAAADQLTIMLHVLIAEKRRQPAADLGSALIAAADDRERLSESELLATLTLLIIAGHHPTVNLIANGILALLCNPAQLSALRAQPTLMPGAVEELLRFDGPVNIATIGFSTETIRVGDLQIGPGQFVMISLLAANRDARHFTDPDQLDIARKDVEHLGFGHGIHHCVGAPLGRMEGRIALTRLLDRFSTLELATTEPIKYRDSIVIHGPIALPVRCNTA